MDYVCPYCKVVLSKIPGRKTKCKSCGKHYYVRTKYPGETKQILTEAEASIDTWFKRLSMFRVSEEEVKQTEGKRDGLWRLLNNLLIRFAKENDLQNLKMVYFEMALFLDEEGKDPYPLLCEVVKTELQDYKKQEIIKIKKVRIISPGGCSECKVNDGKIFDIDDALKTMPIPNKNCKFHLNSEYGWCRCRFLVHFER